VTPPAAPEIDRLYREHGYVVLARAQQILGDRQEALDVLHEVFEMILARPGTFAGRSAVTTWLYAVTTNLCLNTLRNRRTRDRLARARAAGARTAIAPTGDARLLARDVLAKLPARQAEAAIYYFVDEMSQEEIAEILGCSRRRVGDLIADAQARFAEEEAA
jgi:RNA polymerase sigma-70 factor (ECF subfamily)